MSTDKNKGMNASRREFLRTASMLSVVGTASAPFALNLATMGAAAAQNAPSDYKAIICLFFLGGNDHANTVLATDPESWNQYISVRTTTGNDSIALPAASVLAIAPNTTQSGRSFGLHPSLQPLKGLFDAGRAAVIANVGPLIMPTTKTQYKQAGFSLPAKLFSHNDQQSTWQAYSPEGATAGWGGRMGDLFASQNTYATLTAISTSGNAVFLAGKNIIQYQINAAGAVPIGGLSGSLFGSSSALNPLKSVITGERSNFFEKDHAAVVNRSIDAQAILSTAMLPATSVLAPTTYTNPNTNALVANPLATNFQTVARIIGARSALGARRQIFFIGLGGFDTHDAQKVSQGDLLARVAHALAYFDSALSNLQGADLRSQVTTFTASDFGRTFTSNGDGTDHGWGSHHFVTGGAVKGKDIYGGFPPLGLGHAQDAGSGSLIPSISVEQYGATIAKWFGLNDSQINDIFPNIRNFTVRDLGFMI